jgi:hypothetical protein
MPTSSAVKFNATLINSHHGLTGTEKIPVPEQPDPCAILTSGPVGHSLIRPAMQQVYRSSCFEQ